MTTAAINKSTSSQLTQSEIDLLNYQQLDAYIDDGFSSIDDLATQLLPYLQRMHDLLAGMQGQRSDLQKKAGVPVGMTWQRWVEKKKDTIGSISTVNRLLKAAKEEAALPPLSDGAAVVVKATKTQATVIHDDLKASKVLVDEVVSDPDNPIRSAYKRSELIPAAEYLVQQADEAAETEKAAKPEKKPCYFCAQKATKIEKLEAEIKQLNQIICGWQKVTGAKSTSAFANKLEKENEERKKQAAKPTASNPIPKVTGSIIGVKSDPIDGLYWEGIKHDTTPFVIHDANNPHVGVMTMCNSQMATEKYINDRIRERNLDKIAAKTEAAAVSA